MIQISAPGWFKRWKARSLLRQLGHSPIDSTKLHLTVLELSNLSMNENTVKEVLYSSIAALANRREYYYHSPIGANYCHWTEKGQEEVAKLLTTLTPAILQAQHDALDQRAKDLVMNTLKE